VTLGEFEGFSGVASKVKVHYKKLMLFKAIQAFLW